MSADYHDLKRRKLYSTDMVPTEQNSDDSEDDSISSDSEIYSHMEEEDQNATRKRNKRRKRGCDFQNFCNRLLNLNSLKL